MLSNKIGDLKICKEFDLDVQTELGPVKKLDPNFLKLLDLPNISGHVSLKKNKIMYRAPLHLSLSLYICIYIYLL